MLLERAYRELRSFWSGLTTYSLSSALGAVGVAVAELLLAMVFVTPTGLARLRPGYLKESQLDDQVDVTIGALRLALKPVRRRGVVYLGASNAANALYDRGSFISRKLTSSLGERVDFHQLAGNNESVADWV